MKRANWNSLAWICAATIAIGLPAAAGGQGIMDRIRQKAQDKVQQKTDSLHAAREAKLDSLSQGVVDKATGAVECLVTNTACIKRAFGKGKSVELVDSTGKAVPASDSTKAIAAAGGVPPSVMTAAPSGSTPAADTSPSISTAAPASSSPAAPLPSGATASPNGTPFQGIITVHVVSDDGTANDMPYQIKGSKMRIDMTSPDGQSGSVIMDGASQRSIVLVPSQRMYMDMDFGGQAASSQSNKPSDIVFTGMHETIAGWPCDDATYTDSDGKTVDLCLAKGLGGFARPPMGNGVRGRGARGGGGGGPNFGQDMFPLKVVKAGKLELQVIGIERKSLDQSLFEVPAGWQKFGGRP